VTSLIWNSDITNSSWHQRSSSSRMHKRSLGIRSTGEIFGLPRMVYSPRYSQEGWWGCRLLCCRQQQMSTRTPQMLHSHPCRALQSVSELIWACCSGKNVTITCLMSPMVQELSCSQTLPQTNTTANNSPRYASAARVALVARVNSACYITQTAYVCPICIASCKPHILTPSRWEQAVWLPGLADTVCPHPPLTWPLTV